MAKTTTGIRKRGRNRKYNVNENYFKEIDSQEKAYWLGFLFAECTLDEKRYCLGVKLGPEEKEQLERCRAAMGSNHPIKPVNNVENPAWSLKIGSKALCEDLRQFGLGKGKTLNLKWPSLRDDLVPHFIRGFFDGDGWISNWIERKSGNKTWVIGFATCSKGFLESLQQVINHSTGVDAGSLVSRSYDNPNWHDGHQLFYGGNGNVERLGKLIYANARPYLSRKKNKFDEFLMASRKN